MKATYETLQSEILGGNLIQFTVKLFKHKKGYYVVSFMGNDEVIFHNEFKLSDYQDPYRAAYVEWLVTCGTVRETMAFIKRNVF